MVELAYTAFLNSAAFGIVGSWPTTGTKYVATRSNSGNVVNYQSSVGDCCNVSDELIVYPDLLTPGRATLKTVTTFIRGVVR